MAKYGKMPRILQVTSFINITLLLEIESSFAMPSAWILYRYKLWLRKYGLVTLQDLDNFIYVLKAFLGCLIAGVVAVPIYPPNAARLTYSVNKMNHVIKNSGAKLILSHR